MADASKLRRFRRAGLGAPPAIEEARSDLTPNQEPADDGDRRQQEAGTSGPPGEAEMAAGPREGAAAPRTGRIDGRTLRRSGRTVQFATRVSPDFDERIREIAKREGKLLVEVLEQALEAYEASRQNAAR
jgi:hypothetical protein